MTSGTEVPVLTFLGGAGTVTGSKFLLEARGSRVLVDCGLFQGLKDLRLQNWDRFPIDPSTIDAVVITHAHIDHCGYVPRLVASGFDGPIFASAHTVDLAGIVLPDSGHLQEEEASYANARGYSKHRPALPLYTEEDARRSLERFVPIEFGEVVESVPHVRITLDPAGHILGSAIVRIGIDRLDGGSHRVVFSGDLGRAHHPLLVPPAPLGAADVVVVESTYGDREHDDTGALDVLARAISRTVGRGGVVLVPAFAVDRTEVLLVHLRQLRERGAIPDVPIYVDSPMALAALSVYRRAIAAGSAEIAPEVVSADDPFGASSVEEVRDVEGSMALDRLTAPAIVISASGMATGGRVLHHLRRYLPDHRATIVLVGFQAQQTRGRQLADGARQIKLLGRYIAVRADVVDLPSFSVHADRAELLRWLRSASSPPDVVHVVHGEPASAAALQSAINDELGWVATVPSQGERVRLD